MNTQECLINDLQKQGPEEVTLIYRENGKGKKESERISPFVLIFDANGEPTNFNCKKERMLDKAEVEGLRSMWELASEYGYVVWTSPKDGPAEYTEGRGVFGKVVKRGEETVIDCRGFPILNSGEELKRMVGRLLTVGGVSMDEITDVESLRKEAVGINCKDKDEFWDICEKVFGNHDVWEKIRNGDDLKETKVVEKVVIQVMRELVVRGRSNDAYIFETIMQQRGYGLMAGNHGGLNAPMFGAFDSLFNLPSMVSSESLDSRLEECGTCHLYYMKKKGGCPKCKC